MMRTPLLIAAAFSALLPGLVQAQTTPPAGAPAGPQKPATEPATAAQPAAEEEVNTGWVGFVDVGVRGTSVTGDPARYQRYRDLSDGLIMENVRADREARGWLLGFLGEHVGRHDQRFGATAVRPGRLEGSFLWDQIPMLLSETTRTLYTGIGTDTLRIDDPLQALVQASPSAITSVFNQSSREFETKTRRHIADAAVKYSPNDGLTFTTDFRHTNREGTIPYGGSYGHSSVVELPGPTLQTINDFRGDAEYVRDPVLLRAGYNGSWFHNDVSSIIFDNPFRVSDIPATPASGRLSVPPSNSFVGVNGMASVKMPGRSRATAYASLGMLQDSDTVLIPQTINSSFTTAPLQRTVLDGEARTSSVNLRFTSRPNNLTDIQVSYRTYEYDNKTPEFDMSQRVAYDNTPAAVAPPAPTEPFSVSRGAFDADFRVTPGQRISAGIGYSRLGEDRTHRIFDSTTDNVLRLTFDSIARQWFSVRTRYDHAERRGTGIEAGEEELAEIGEQPGMRHFDIADRNRDRVTIIGTVTPTSSLIANLSFAAGKDDYLDSEFGVRDNNHRIYSLGADYIANENVSFGLSYEHERYFTLSRSRQASPGDQFNDPSRNWATEATDKSDSILLNLDVNRIGGKTDLRITYDFSRSRGIYHYITGPVADRTLPEEVIVPTTLPTPSELPPTLSEFNRGTADLIYALTNRFSVAGSYTYDQWRVEDFTLDLDANPQLARGQALLMGYLYRPYSANTASVRLLYRW